MENIKTEWDLTPLLKTESEKEIQEERAKIQEVANAFINKWKNNQNYLTDPKILKQALDEYEEWNRKLGYGGKTKYYFQLKLFKDQNDPKIKAEFNKIIDFVKKISNDTNFFTLNLAKIPEEKQKEFLSNKELKPYHHILETIFLQSKHLLSEKEEKIMTLKSQPASENWVQMVSGFLAKEEHETLLEDNSKAVKTLPELSNLIRSQNKKVRDSAGQAIEDIMNKNIDAAEAEINSILANKKIDDELRNFPRPDSSRHLDDDVKTEVVDLLINTVSNRFNISQRYYKLKAKLLKVKTLKYHERNVDYGHTDKKYEYKEAVEIIDKVTKELDKKFNDIFVNFCKNGNIDVYSKKGKRDGACCMYNLIEQPTYILLNYNDKLQDILTLAHEFGHGTNNELMKEKQNSLTFGTPTSTAEVASTFMEDFVFQELIKEADEELKLSLMVMKLHDDVSTILRQVACYKFEQELHEEFRKAGYISKEEIGKIFKKHMASYMGEEFAEGSENWWVIWPHIREFFYVYSYASGLLISKSLQASVKKDKKFIEKVKIFFSTGLSESPEDIFKKLDVNINNKEFWNKGLNEIEELLNETETLAKKLGKI